MTTTTKPSNEATELFDQALQSFETVLKSGVTFQQEQFKRFTDSLGAFSSPYDWLKRTQAVINDAIPATRRQIDEIGRAMQQNTTTCLEMLEKACAASRSTSMSEAQDKTRQLWEALLAAQRTNTQAIVQANARMLEIWTELAQTGSSPESTEEKAEEKAAGESPEG